MKIKVEPIKVNYYPEVCELCGGKVIITSKEDISGKCYCCVNCGAYAKTYMEEPDKAMTILSTEEMHSLRKKCCSLFRNIWKNAKDSKRVRKCLYGWLADKLKLDCSDCTFSFLNLEQLKSVEKTLLEVRWRTPVFDRNRRLYFR